MSRKTNLNRTLLLALGLAMLGAGCQSPASKAPAPVASPLSSAAPQDAQQPVIAASSAPSQAATTFDEDAGALPAALLDSDVESTDQTAIETQLATDELKAYLPTDLIHDGGAVFFQLLGVQAPRLAGKTDLKGELAALPSAWQRRDVEQSGRQAKMRRVKGADGKASARVNIRYFQRGQFVYQDPKTGARVQKRYGEIFSRSFEFRLGGAKPVLAGVSPVNIESNGGRSGLGIARVSVGLSDGSKRVLLDDLERTIAPSEQISLPAGQSVSLEVEGIPPASGAFVFARIPGESKRVQLMEDAGSSGRSSVLYTALVTTPSKPGAYHLAVDMIDSATFRPARFYRAHGVGVTIKVQ